MSSAILVCEQGPLQGRKFPLSGKTTVGRGQEADIRIPDRNLSRCHVELGFDEASSCWTLHDLGSLNGSFVNGARVPTAALNDGSIVEVGDNRFFFYQTKQKTKRAAGGDTLALARKGPAPGILQSQNPVDLMDTAGGATLVATTLPDSQLRVLLEVGLLIGQYRDMPALYDQLIEKLVGAFPHAQFIALLLGNERSVTIASCWSPAEDGDSVALSATIIGTAFERKQALVAVDALEDSRFQGAGSIASHEIASAICVPMIFQDNILGALYAATKNMNQRFEDRDLTLMNSIAAQVGLAVHNAQLVAELEQENADLAKSLTDLKTVLERLRMTHRAAQQHMPDTPPREE